MPDASPELKSKQKWLRAIGFLLLCAFLLAFYPNFLVALMALGTIIFVHELGHFTLCKLSGISVERFSIGFGAPLLSIRRGGTTYQVAAIPLGGFVKPAGEFEEKEERTQPHPPDHFLAKPWWLRGLVLLAGPLANFALPVAFAFGLYATLGYPLELAPPLVQEVVEDSAAAEAGLKKGDQILKVDGEWATGIEVLAKLVDQAARRHPGKPTALLVWREEQEFLLQALSRLDRELGRYRLGIHITPGPPPQRRVVARVWPGTPAEKAGFRSGDEIVAVGGKLLKAGAGFYRIFSQAAGEQGASGEAVVRLELLRAGKAITLFAPKRQPLPESWDAAELGLLGLELEREAAFADGRTRRFQRLNLMQAALVAWNENIFQAGVMLNGLWDLLRGRLNFKESVSGPVGIVRIAQQQAGVGLLELLQLMMRISLILGIMNLLPIPLLDGGTLLLCLVEGLRRKPLSLKLQQVLQQASAALLIALMLFATYNDLANWWQSLMRR